MDQLFADRVNDVTYITVFPGHLKWHNNKHLHIKVLHYVRINALHVDVYRVELFSNAAITCYTRYIITDIGCSMLAVMDVMH